MHALRTDGHGMMITHLCCVTTDSLCQILTCDLTVDMYKQGIRCQNCVTKNTKNCTAPGFKRTGASKKTNRDPNAEVVKNTKRKRQKDKANRPAAVASNTELSDARNIQTSVKDGNVVSLEQSTNSTATEQVSEEENGYVDWDEVERVLNNPNYH